MFVVTLSMSPFYPLWLGRPTFAPTAAPRINDFRVDFIHDAFLSSVLRSANICPNGTTEDKGFPWCLYPRILFILCGVKLRGLLCIGGKGLPWLDSTSAAPGTLLLRGCTTAGAGTRR